MTWETLGAAVGAVSTLVGLAVLPVKYVAGLGRRITVVERDQKWLIQSTSKQETLIRDTTRKVDTLNVEVAALNVEVTAVKTTAQSTENKVDMLVAHLIGKVE